jgi:predicted lysophospholipase L1 biosynthesis ABC-type transport system permease subunit
MMRQSLTESLLLSLLGGVGGCLLAYALLRWFVLLAPSGIPHLSGATLDLRVLAFGLCAALLSGLVFGVAPLRATPRVEMLAGTRATSFTSTRSRGMLVGGQLALSLVLLTCAGALLQSLWKRQALSLGLSTDRIVTAQFVLGQRYDQPAARAAFYEQLEERLAM